MVSLKTVQVHWNFASVSVLKRLTTWVVAIDNSCQSTQNFNSVSVLKIYSNWHRLDWYTELANFPESLCLFGHVRQPAPPSVALAKLLANWHFHMLPTSFSGIFLLLDRCNSETWQLQLHWTFMRKLLKSSNCCGIIENCPSTLKFRFGFSFETFNNLSCCDR